MLVIEGKLEVKKAKIAIVEARFNHFINDRLTEGAIDALVRIGGVSENNITLVKVPGAYEIPLTISALAETKKYDAVIAIGTVIRGSTAHFDYVAGEASSGLLNTSLKYALPVAFGILTTENIDQAIERAGTKAGNKGFEAAMTVLEMINTLDLIKNSKG